VTLVSPEIAADVSLGGRNASLNAWRITFGWSLAAAASAARLLYRMKKAFPTKKEGPVGKVIWVVGEEDLQL